ncbi:protein kinase domain-containing protein [Streptomyces cuspidosporus]|uniref:Protein kinase domain-containing protein n=1 Tax=Streptomyces cuspidosporus TaxID=66882 RepID=A0ABP5UAS4_9ACTN
MSERAPARPEAGELTAADLEELGAKPLLKADPADIGPYRVLARLGGGGMGRLYLGRDAGDAAGYRAESLVAIKVIRPEYAEDPGFRRRFEREVEAVRRVHGTYTAGLLDSGFDDEERLWMATAYIPGLSLADAVRRFGPLPAPVVWRLACEIGQALGAIAAAGIVHRDLKPSNVLLGGDGVRVIDFGVAHTADTSALTMTGQQLGTPAFMSPEQANGREVDTASDVFSLGSVLALAAAGTAPFGEGATGDVVHRVIYAPPDEAVLAKVAETDPELAELITGCLAKTAAERPTPRRIAELARGHELALTWPAPVARVIESRATWMGPTAAVPPMDQLTVLRRAAPERAAGEATRSRRPLVLTGAAVAAVAVGALAFAVPRMGSASEERAEKPAASPRSASATPSHPAPTGKAPKKGGKHRTESPPAPGSTTVIVVSPPTGRPADGVPSGEGASPRPQPRQPGDKATAPHKAPAPTGEPQPWKSCDAYAGTALTQLGDRNRRVVQVQCILKGRGYDIGPHGIDGQFGADTLAAVKSFQRHHGLRADGQVGVHTWAALRG